MTPDDVEKAIDALVSWRDYRIKVFGERGATACSYSPGMFEGIEADFRALRKIQANTTPREETVLVAPGGDGLYRFPKWAQEPGH